MKTVQAVTASASILMLACASAPPKVPAAGEPALIRVNTKRQAWPLEVLVEGLSSPDEAVRAQAAWELSVAKDVPDRVYERLADMITSDPSPQVRAAAAWASPEGGSDTPPKLVAQSRPVYPAEALQRGIQGTVELNILIGETGKVTHAEITRSVAGLDAAAITCVMAWIFEPARKGGRPVAIKASVPLMFAIK